MKSTDQGLRNVKDTLARMEQASAAAQNSDGRLVGTWWTQGAYDIVTVFELPDDETASAFMLSNALVGHLRSETMRAYTREEMQRIVQKLP